MKLKNLLLALLLFLIAFSLKAQCPPSTDSFSTPFAENNGWTGIMFDINALNTVEITCFDINLEGGFTRDFDIYTRPGTHVGFEDSPAGWVLVGTVTGVVSLGTNIPTPVPIPVNVRIEAGQKAAFYITATAGTLGQAVAYTTAPGGSIPGVTVFASNADLEVTTGTGKGYPFGINFRPREVNVVIHYGPQRISTIPVIPEYTPILTGTAAYSEVNLEWSTPIDTTGTLPPIQEFEVYITDDGGITYTLVALTRDYFISLPLINGIEYGFRVRPIYVIQGGNNYLPGNYSNLVFLRPSIILGTEEGKSTGVSVFPNPSEGNFTLRFANIISQKTTIKVMDLTGKVMLTQEVSTTDRSSSYSVSLPQAAAGMYIVQIETEKGIYQHKISITK